MANSAVKKRKIENKHGKMDITFFSLVIILLTVGLVMLFSASYAYSLEYYNNSYKFIIRQAAFGAVGVVIMLLVSRIPYNFWKKFSWAAYFITVLMLLILLIFPPMVSGMDVKRWMAIGSFTFQPSEIAKFSIVLLFAALISSNYKQMKDFKFIMFFSTNLFDISFSSALILSICLFRVIAFSVLVKVLPSYSNNLTP